MNDLLPPLRVAGHGVVLREWYDEDLHAAVELFDDPDIAFRTPFVTPFDLEAARRHVEKTRRTGTAGERVCLVITTDGRQAKGEVFLNVPRGSIGYVVGAAHRGQGLATRAVMVMTEYAHRVRALPRVVLEIEPDNEPSIAVARAAGFYPTDEPADMVEDKGRRYALLTWAHDAVPPPVASFPRP